MKKITGKKKGRYVLEAAVLVPGICVLLVYLVYFTLYTHDCAVVTHGILESGVKGIYRDMGSDAARKEQIQEDLKYKLEERLAWIEHVKVEVEVNPIRAVVKVSGRGRFLPAQINIEKEETIYRIAPDKIIRRSRWIKNSGGENI